MDVSLAAVVLCEADPGDVLQPLCDCRPPLGPQPVNTAISWSVISKQPESCKVGDELSFRFAVVYTFDADDRLAGEKIYARHSGRSQPQKLRQCIVKNFCRVLRGAPRGIFDLVPATCARCSDDCVGRRRTHRWQKY